MLHDVVIQHRMLRILRVCFQVRYDTPPPTTPFPPQQPPFSFQQLQFSFALDFFGALIYRTQSLAVVRAAPPLSILQGAALTEHTIF